ncbi:MAG TPA: hypothetical protein VM121_06310 [Acidimicrobiales bacterium]|nr:hypothetical protein [Acidimicrobiales bacterium]
MKLVFGKGKVSREEIEQQAASEIDALISSSDGPPPIDWSVYALSADVADPAVASDGLTAAATAGAQDNIDDLDGERPALAGLAPEPPAPRRRSTTSRAKSAPRSTGGSRTTTATKAKPKGKATARPRTAKPRARTPKKPTS